MVYSTSHLVFTSRIICLCFVEGIIVPVKAHEAIPMADVQWLAEFMDGEPKVPFINALSMLRRKHFPFFYDPHPWVAGELDLVL